MVSNQQGAPVAGVLLRWVDMGGAASETRTGADGAYALDLVGVTAVGEVFGSGPTAHALGQNYPNPFNPSTTLPFALAVGGSVRLTIYNAMGQSVRVLLDGDLAAGRHEVRWDGSDAGGRPTAAGVYLYQLQAGGVVRQRKMLRVDGGMVPTGPRARPVLQARSYAVQLSGDHIVDEEIAVAVDGDSCVDFAVDERLLWTQRAPMPTPRQEVTAVLSEHLAVAAADGMIYAISGRFGANRAGVHAYDPATAAWSERPAIPTARSGIAAAVWMGWIHVFGGEIPGVFAQHEVYDPTARVWAMAAPMPTARHGLASGVVDGKIYVIGGGTVAGLRATGVVEEYVP